MMERIAAVVVDFDGTVVPEDVTEEILKAMAPPEWWDIDLEFRRGEIGSRECLIRQASLLRGQEREMVAFALDRCGVDPSFPPFVAWAREAGLRVAVASDGMGFYIEPMLRASGVEGVEVLTNRVRFGGRLPRFAFPNGHPVCVGCGTCKMRIVRTYRSRFGRVAFVGEGHTDRYGALYSDLVFAKAHLVEICRSDGVPFLPWEDFDDVRAGIEGTAPPGAVDPEQCPGWTEP